MDSGTAWALTGGRLVTAAHVVDELGGDRLDAVTFGGARYAVTDIRRVQSSDLAFLSAADEPGTTLPLGRSTELEAGQPLVQIGHTRVAYWAVTLGRFRGTVERSSMALLTSDLPVMRGNSGSPVLTLDGDVVGMTVGTISGAGQPPHDHPRPEPLRVYEDYPRRDVRHTVHLPADTIRRSLSSGIRGTID